MNRNVKCGSRCVLEENESFNSRGITKNLFYKIYIEVYIIENIRNTIKPSLFELFERGAVFKRQISLALRRSQVLQ